MQKGTIVLVVKIIICFGKLLHFGEKRGNSFVENNSKENLACGEKIQISGLNQIRLNVVVGINF